MKNVPESEEFDTEAVEKYTNGDPAATKKSSSIIYIVVPVMLFLTVWLLVVITQHPDVMSVIQGWLPMHSTVGTSFNTTDELFQGAEELLRRVTMRGDKEGMMFVRHAATPLDTQTHTINHLQAMSTIALAHFNCSEVPVHNTHAFVM